MLGFGRVKCRVSGGLSVGFLRMLNIGFWGESSVGFWGRLSVKLQGGLGFRKG